MKAVGICLGTRGATIAVVETTATGWRLLKVAEMSWPGGDLAAASSARMLARSRRMIGLPGRQAVAVTSPPGVELDTYTTGMLFARANLVRCWTIDPRIAFGIGARLVAAIDRELNPDLAHRAATGAARLAAGAAIAATAPPRPQTPQQPRPQPQPVLEPAWQPEPHLRLRPLPPPKPQAPPKPEPQNEPQPLAENLPELGWAVRHVTSGARQRRLDLDALIGANAYLPGPDQGRPPAAARHQRPGDGRH
jgi:hypothetical protein